MLTVAVRFRCRSLASVSLSFFDHSPSRGQRWLAVKPVFASVATGGSGSGYACVDHDSVSGILEGRLTRGRDHL